jgi:thiamine-phosphate pyrophosphorylase
VVNDRVDVALALGADGVHVGQDDMPVHAVRTLAPYLTVGLSVSSLGEVLASRDCLPDYFGMGPVFQTASKSDAGEPVGIARLRDWIQEAGGPCPRGGGWGCYPGQGRAGGAVGGGGGPGF